jgi:uncharacterized protein
LKIKNEELTEKELETLAEILDEISPDAMNLEMLDGVFCALICSPTLVPLSDYIPVIVGEDYSFSSEKQATTFFELTMRHWNFIAEELLKSLDKNHAYFPLIFEDENGVRRGNDWATGFMEGVHLSQDGWDELFENEEYEGCIIPIMMLHHEHNPDEKLRPPAIPSEKRDEILIMMLAGLVHIYRFFEPYRAATTTTIRREGVKVGRNDPCPCGSNRKYKQCCGNNSPTIH